MKLEQLTQRIQDLVPEVMENPWTAIVKAGELDLKECDDVDGVRELTGQIERAKEMERDFNGIEIQLNHVLLAMQRIPVLDVIGVSFNGDFMDCDNDLNNLVERGDTWDLSKPLSGQSEGVISFLLDTLTKKPVPSFTKEQIEDPIEMIIWDLETTGFVAPESRILEIGAIVLREGKEPEHKHWVINENIEIPEEITKITGITREIVQAEGRDAKECLNEFLPLLYAAKKNITHNGIRFDIPFLVAYADDVLKHSEEESIKLESILRMTAYDTAVHFKATKLGEKQKDGESFVQFASRVMEIRAFGVKYNLALCCEEAKVDLTGITFHRALGDVAMTYELYKYIHA